ncbi:hypothetical protein [Pseudomonas huanghezhanensis]|uniref:hypothetical protein n=1 Tax=Pseudomonas huanghezhanensis TaxID=3002903 RepID=UPI0022858DE7|nr:hypothetical protein [Pseudomonas sp. BSw22131]
MDKKHASIELYSPGIIIFDPLVLDGFLVENDVIGSNVFNAFLEDEVLGRAAIDEGILIPVYQIPEDEYSVLIDGEALGEKNRVGLKFDYPGISLEVSSGIVVVADLNALTDWDSDFFKNYKANYQGRLPNSDYLEVASGLYSVTVSGYVGLQSPLKYRGYGLTFFPTVRFKKSDQKSAVDDRDFTL